VDDGGGSVTVALPPSEIARLKAKAERDKFEDKLASQLAAVGIYPQRQFKFHPTRRWLADFWLAEHKLLIEVDGGGWMNGKGHFSEHGRRHDGERDRAATLMGYRVVRFTGSEVTDGSALRTIQEMVEGEAA
jgi:very-short-patch-repair endonuclease